MKTLRVTSALLALMVTAAEVHAGDLFVSTPLVDFGNVAIQGPPALSVVTLTNLGSDTFVQGLTGGFCPSFGHFAPFPVVLGNGQSMQIEVSFDPQMRGGAGCAFTVQDNDPNVDSFQLTGVGTAPALSVLSPPFPQALFFANQPWDGGTPEIRPVVFRNSGNQAIEEGDFDVSLQDGVHYFFGLPDFPIPAGADAAVDVTFDPTSEGLKLDAISLGLNNGLPGEFPVSVDLEGTGTTTTGVEPGVDAIGLHLIGANPVSAASRLSYVLPGTGRAKLGVYDMTGRLVRPLVDRVEGAGRHEAPWSGGTTVALGSGVYVVRLSFDGRVLGTRRIVVLR